LLLLLLLLLHKHTLHVLF